MDLQDKGVLITGATSGIGLACARAVAERGARVMIAGRRADVLEREAASIPGCVSVAGEITADGFVESLLDRAAAELGRLDVVVNNAGLVASASIDDIDVDAVCRMVRVNVEAAFRLMYLAARRLKAAGGGHLINTSSVLGTKVRPHIGAYAGTKHAIEALSESLRMELAGTGVCVTCVEPGLVRTDLHRDWEVRPEQALGVGAPLTAEDVARAVLFALDQPAHAYVPRVMILPREQVV